MITYPLNNVMYSAEDAELYNASRTSGLYTEDDFLYYASGANNNIIINEGLAWINNGKFLGKVAALKSPQTIDLGLPDSALPRIDIVAIQFDANLNETKLVIKKSAPSTNPTIPAIVKTEALYELYLYQIFRPAAAAVVTDGDITDLRLNPVYCGLMSDGANGPPGPAGLSAYQYAQAGGYEGSESDFSAKLAAEYAPPYTYGTQDLKAGETALETGRLHFVYE